MFQLQSDRAYGDSVCEVMVQQEGGSYGQTGRRHIRFGVGRGGATEGEEGGLFQVRGYHHKAGGGVQGQPGNADVQAEGAVPDCPSTEKDGDLKRKFTIRATPDSGATSTRSSRLILCSDSRCPPNTQKLVCSVPRRASAWSAQGR